MVITNSESSVALDSKGDETVVLSELEQVQDLITAFNDTLTAHPDDFIVFGVKGRKEDDATYIYTDAGVYLGHEYYQFSNVLESSPETTGGKTIEKFVVQEPRNAPDMSRPPVKGAGKPKCEIKLKFVTTETPPDEHALGRITLPGRGLVDVEVGDIWSRTIPVGHAIDILKRAKTEGKFEEMLRSSPGSIGAPGFELTYREFKTRMQDKPSSNPFSFISPPPPTEPQT